MSAKETFIAVYTGCFFPENSIISLLTENKGYPFYPSSIKCGYTFA
ncbi:hypothetical protein BACEGG_00581 [Bacteroides eggerthii DSM 20697]|nr:hypothetical protein BACEGG_00581 [Bacteroides eggerthii DSM 20697]